MKRRRSFHAGFTLLELIVALAISSLVAIMGAGAMSTVLDFYQRNANRSSVREDVRAVERTLRHEWETRGVSIRSDGSMLEFYTLYPVVRQAPPSLTVAHVRYACENTMAEGLALTHRVRSAAAGQVGVVQHGQRAAYDETRILASRLQTCAFSFLGTIPSPQGKPQPQWFTTWDEKTPAPVLMRLALSGVRADVPPVVYQARTGDRP